MGPIILCAVFLLSSCQMRGTRAMTPVFVQKGNDVLLDVMKADVPKKFTFLLWSFKGSNNLVTFVPDKEPIIPEVYTERVEFSVKNYSVKLKNLQETDSGVYTAQVTASKEEQIAEYNVTVQDPVSPVKLTVDSVSISSDSCNLTVTCRTQDSHISSTFTCDMQACSHEEGERSKVTTSVASLQVSMVNDSINCNHSNQVSWAKNMTKIQDFCPRYSEPKLKWNHVIVIVLVIFIILVIAIVAAVYCHLKTVRKKKTVDIDSTVYSLIQLDTTAQTLPRRSDNDSSSFSPTSTYCLVGPHTGSTGSTALPESLYAQVEKTGRA